MSGASVDQPGQHGQSILPESGVLVFRRGFEGRRRVGQHGPGKGRGHPPPTGVPAIARPWPGRRAGRSCWTTRFTASSASRDRPRWRKAAALRLRALGFRALASSERSTSSRAAGQVAPKRGQISASRRITGGSPGQAPGGLEKGVVRLVEPALGLQGQAQVVEGLAVPGRCVAGCEPLDRLAEGASASANRACFSLRIPSAVFTRASPGSRFRASSQYGSGSRRGIVELVDLQAREIELLVRLELPEAGESGRGPASASGFSRTGV